MDEYIKKSEIEKLYFCFLKIIEEQKQESKDSLDSILLNGVKTGMDILIKWIRELKSENCGEERND